MRNGQPVYVLSELGKQRAREEGITLREDGSCPTPRTGGRTVMEEILEGLRREEAFHEEVRVEVIKSGDSEPAGEYCHVRPLYRLSAQGKRKAESGELAAPVGAVVGQGATLRVIYEDLPGMCALLVGRFGPVYKPKWFRHVSPAVGGCRRGVGRDHE